MCKSLDEYEASLDLKGPRGNQVQPADMELLLQTSMIIRFFELIGGTEGH